MLGLLCRYILLEINNVLRYYNYVLMIASFSCIETELIFNYHRSRIIPSEIQRTALRKLLMLDSALNLMDLRIPPANRLEKLKGNLQGLHSIRINDQWRICFRWQNGHAHDVKIIDYH